MASESCIVYPAESSFIVIREALMAICQIPTPDKDGLETIAPDPQAAAAILNQFIFWTNGKLSDKHQKRYHEAAAASEGGQSAQDHSLWIYKDYDDLKIDLLDIFGRNKIVENTQWLVLAGYLKRRTNPRYHWDKTLQYAVDVECVQSRINAGREFVFNQTIGLNKTLNKRKTKRAIPKNITENTREEDKEIAPASAAAAPSPSSSSVDGTKKSAQADNQAKATQNAQDEEHPLQSSAKGSPIFPVGSFAMWKNTRCEVLEVWQTDHRTIQYQGMGRKVEVKALGADTGVIAQPPAPKEKSILAWIIDDTWAGRTGKRTDAAGMNNRLIPVLMGTSKKHERVEPSANECEILAFGRWYRFEHPSTPLPMEAKLASWFGMFRGSDDYERRVKNAQHDLNTLYHTQAAPQTPPIAPQKASQAQIDAALARRDALFKQIYGDSK